MYCALELASLFLHPRDGALSGFSEPGLSTSRPITYPQWFSSFSPNLPCYRSPELSAAFVTWPHIEPLDRIIQTNWFAASTNCNVSVKQSADSFGPSLKRWSRWLAAGRNHNEPTQQISRNQRDQLAGQSRRPACLQIWRMLMIKTATSWRFVVLRHSNVGAASRHKNITWETRCYSARFSAVRIDSRSFSSAGGNRNSRPVPHVAPVKGHSGGRADRWLFRTSPSLHLTYIKYRLNVSTVVTKLSLEKLNKIKKFWVWL